MKKISFIFFLSSCSLFAGTVFPPNTIPFESVSATNGLGAKYGPGTFGTVSSGLIEAWGTGGKTVYVLPGVYSFTTNSLVMPPNTKLIGLGKVVFQQTGGANSGPLLGLNTNCVVDNIIITNTLPAFATACIGVGTNSPGCSNAIVQNCIFYGNSNAVYFPNAGAASQVHLLNCQINGNVDIHPGQIPTATSVANSQSNEINLINCIVNGTVIVSTGYSNRLMTVGGTINQTLNYYGMELFWNQAYVNGTLIHGGTNADLHVHSARVHFSNTGVPGSRLFTSAFSAISQQGLPILALDESLQNSLAAGDMFTFSDPGQQLFSLANNCFELFDGLQWRPISPAIDTNRVIVTGASDSNFNGVYTYKANTIGGTYGLDFTNINTKHFLYSPDLYTNQVGSAQDSPVALSATASLTDGNEYDVVDFFWGAWQGNPAIHVEFVQTNGISARGQGNSVNWTNTGNIDSATFTGNGAGLTSVTPTITNYAIYASGTAYTLTGSSAALDFGTIDPVLTIQRAGTYMIQGNVGVKYTSATYAGAQTVTFKFRRTNNTAADLTSGSRAIELPVLTTFTGGDVMAMPPIIYTTALANDTITIFGILSATPSAGSVQTDSAEIIAVRLY